MAVTEIDVCNAALAKNHVLDDIASSDGTVAAATSSGVATTLCKRFFAAARQQILRLASWTCVQKRLTLGKAAAPRSTAVLAGAMAVQANTTGPALFKCTTAGTTASSAPTFPTTGTVSDGSAVWTFVCQLLAALPTDNMTGFQYGFPLPADYINQIEVADASGRIVDFAIEGSYLYSDLAAPVLVYVPDATNPTAWDPLLREAITTQLASMLAYPITGSHENEVAFGKVALGVVDQAIRKTMREKRQGRLPPEEWMPGLFGATQASAQNGNQG